MAKRRIDTKFVLGLGGIVVLAAGITGGWFGYNIIFKNHNPVWLAAQGDQADAQGDMKSALDFYKQAYSRTKDPAEKEDRGMKLAQYYYDHSDQNADLYGSSIQVWQLLIQNNKNNLAAQKRVLKELYLRATTLGINNAEVWQEIEKHAADVTKLDPKDSQPFQYYASAIIRQSSSNQFDVKRMDQARELLETAIKVNPADEDSFFELAAFDYRRVKALEAQTKMVEANKQRKQVMDRVDAYVKVHTKDSGTWLALGRFYLQAERVDDARKAFQHSIELDSKNVKSYEYLFMLAVNDKNSLAAEDYLKKQIALQPENLRGHYLLAKYYQDNNRRPESLKEYETILTLRKVGKGIDALTNQNYAAEALNMICSLHMDIAQTKGITTAEGKAALEQADKYIKQIQGRRVNDPILLLYRGRMNLIQGATIDAIKLLRQADTMFINVEGSPNWLQTKYLLVEAYGKTGQTGLEREILDKVMMLYPWNLPLGLQRAALLTQLKDYSAARDACLSLLRYDPNNEQVLRLLTIAYGGLNDVENYNKYAAMLPSSDLAYSTARKHLLTGEAKEAWDILKPIVEKDPGNLSAITVAVPALLQLADTAPKKEDGSVFRAQAVKLIDAAIAKNPKNEKLLMMQVVAKNPGATQDELRRALVEGITDPFDKAMAQAFYELGKGNKDKALNLLLDIDKNFQKTDAQSSELIDRIFNIALNAQKWDVAAVYTQKAEKFNVDGAGGKFMKGRYEIARGNMEAGIRTLKEGTAVRPDFSVGWTVLGQAYLQAKQYNLARESLERAVTQKPDNMLAIKPLIQLYISQENPENATPAGPENRQKAVQLLAQARRFAPRDPDLLNFDDVIGNPKDVILRRETIRQSAPEDWDNLRRLAVAYVNAGNLDKARVLLTQIHDKFPEDMRVVNALAQLYRTQKQNAEAFKLYEPYMGSNDPKIRFAALISLGNLYHSVGQNPAAIAAFKSAQTVQDKDSSEADRYLADVYFENENMRDAEALYRQIDQKEKGRNTLVVKRIVETLIRQNKFADAEDLLNKRVFTPENPADPQGMILQGYALMRQNKFAEALKCYNSVLDKNPEHTEALHYRALTQVTMHGDLDQAISDLKRIRSSHPEAMDSRLLLARALRMSRQYTESVQAYQDIVKDKPSLIVARLELAEFLYSLVGPSLRLPPTARDSFSLSLRGIKPAEALQTLLTDSIKLYPDQPQWLGFNGDLQLLLNNRRQGVALHLQAAEMSQWAPEASAAIFNDWIKDKNYERVVDKSTQMLKEYPDKIGLLVSRALALSGQGKTDDAMKDFDRALDLATQRSDFFVIIVRQMYNSVPSEVVLDHLKKRYEADPKNDGVRVGLIQAYLFGERYKEAAEILDPLMADKKSNLRPKLLIMAAQAHYQLHHFDVAQKYYEEILTIDNDDLETLNNLAVLLGEDLKRPAEALPYAERAVKVLKSQPQELVYVNNGNVMDTLGWIKFLAGDPIGGMDELNRALQIDPLPITYYHMGKILQNQKKLAEAKVKLQEGLKQAQQKNDTATQTKIEQLLRDLK